MYGDAPLGSADGATEFEKAAEDITRPQYQNVQDDKHVWMAVLNEELERCKEAGRMDAGVALMDVIKRLSRK
jgi:hypothetical protein